MCKARHGETPLHKACQMGRLDIVKYLMEDVKNNVCSDSTPLHTAIAFGTLKVVQYMIEEQSVGIRITTLLSIILLLH